MKTNGDVMQAVITALADRGCTDEADALARLANTHTCFSKAGVNEPIFTLRGQDKLAPKLLKRWANKAKKRGATPEKVLGALDIAARMREFKPRRNPT